MKKIKKLATRQALRNYWKEIKNPENSTHYTEEIYNECKGFIFALWCENIITFTGFKYLIYISREQMITALCRR